MVINGERRAAARAAGDKARAGVAVWCKSAVLLLVVVLGGVGACARQSGDETLRFALASMPVTLDPRFATDATSARVNRLLYQRLVDFDASAMPVPGLAHWVQLSPTRYRFELRAQRARFTNGGPVTADDVKATYEFILDERNGSPHRISLENIERIEVEDERTLVFHLRDPDILFPGRLVIGVLPRSLIEADHPFNRAPVGSGAFEFVAWPDDNHLRLRRRGDGQRLAFIGVSDPTVRALKLLRGEVDMVQNDLPPELTDYLRARPEIDVKTARGSNFAYLGFNLQDDLAGDPAIRRAIAYAIDRESIIRHVLGGAARPAGSLLPPDHWAGAPSLPVLGHDPARARRILEGAGYDGDNRLRIVYKTSTDPLRLRLATIIQQQLAEAGITVELKSYDWGTFYGDIKAGRFQMYSLMWVGIKLPDIFRYVFHSASVPPDGANRGRFDSPTADRLIERAESATQPGRKARLYRRLQRHLLEKLPYVPLWYEDHVFAARRGISGYEIARDGNYDGLRHVTREHAELIR